MSKNFQIEEKGKVIVRKSLIVSGLVWSMPSTYGNTAVEVLGGPALGAALGAYAASQTKPELLIGVSNTSSFTQCKWIRLLDPAGRLITRLPYPPLRWTSSPLIGNTRKWSLEGNPRNWIATCGRNDLVGRTLVLSNSSPRACFDLLKYRDHSHASIDIDASWAASQPNEIRKCLDNVDLVTITSADFYRMSAVFAGTSVGSTDGAALVMKSGADGVSITVDGRTVSVGSPELKGKLKTDVGAGDVLLGFLSAELFANNAPCTLEMVEDAYLRARPLLSTLLQSEHFFDFASDVINAIDEI
jgi:hypothetical protein